MTGHGRGVVQGKSGTVEVEISSVNRRQLDIRVNIPRDLSVMEPMIHEIVGDRVSRGSVNVLVRFSSYGGRSGFSVDEGLARRYLRELRKLGKSLSLKDDVTLRTILSMPEVVRTSGGWSDEGVRDAIRRAVVLALEGMLGMRTREGAVLAADIQKRFRHLEGMAGRLKRRAVGVTVRYRDNLLKRMKKLGVEFRADSPQIARELAVFADKSDISEELLRLDSHLQQVKDIFRAGGAAGRTLDFLCQEIFREINTVGSKANDSGVSRIVVEFKAHLESIREQVQNVE